MILLGVDPGLSGALAFIQKVGPVVRCDVMEMPILRLKRGGRNRGEINPHGLADILWKAHVGHAFIEEQWNRPVQAARDVCGMCKGFGMILGVLAAVGVPYTLVTPQKWKRALEVPASKDGARARASQLFPSRTDLWPLKKDDGKAEAALIGLYGFRYLNAIASGKAA